MNVAGIYIDSLSIHCLQGTTTDSPLNKTPHTFKTKELLLLLDDKVVPVQGLAQSRLGSHRVCSNFLPYIDSDKTWGIGQNAVHADYALEFYLAEIAETLIPETQVSFALPIYISQKQIRRIEQIALKLRMKVQGSLASSTSLAVENVTTWNGSFNSNLTSDFLVLEIDCFGLSLSWIRLEQGQVQLKAGKIFPEFSWNHWVLKLSDFLAKKSIGHCRKDPRANLKTEMNLFTQAEKLLLSIFAQPSFKIVLDEDFWNQEFLVSTPDLDFCFKSMLRSLNAKINAFIQSNIPESTAIQIICTKKVAMLPGLNAFLKNITRGLPSPSDLTFDSSCSYNICKNAMTMAGQWCQDSLGIGSANGKLSFSTLKI